MADQAITEHTYTINGRAAHVHTSPAPNPASPALLLIHGGWGGAAMHWAPVWSDLARHVRIIAPELPGMGYGSESDTQTIPAFSQWLERLLDHLEIGPVWVAGNSMGGAIAWHLALNAPDRVKGMILINGGPMPPLSKTIRRLFRTRPGRLLAGIIIRRAAFSPKIIESAFADPLRAPGPLVDLGRRRHSPQLRAVTDVIIDGTTEKTAPRQPGLILWGTEDPLHGNQTTLAHRLQKRLHDARLVEIPDAGHMPQLEQPRLVIEAIKTFMGV